MKPVVADHMNSTAEMLMMLSSARWNTSKWDTMVL